jgi:putative polyketide hydroxylase
MYPNDSSDGSRTRATRTTRVDVAILGGGIVGLTAALACAQAGLNAVVIERHASTNDHPRARGVNTRAMEIFRELGIADALRTAAAPLAPSYGFYSGTTLADILGPMPRRRADEKPKLIATTDPEVTAAFGPETGCRVTLDRAEPIILSAALRRGARVWFTTECTEVTQDSESVTLQVRRVGGDAANTEIVIARYLIDAEGAGGRLRQQLGITATTGPSNGHLINVLFDADLGDFVRDREFSVLMIDNDEVKGSLAAVDNNRRWAFHVPYDPAVESLESYTNERLESLVRAALGGSSPDGTVPQVRVISALPWEMIERTADHMRAGRVFVAGDAAHQMPPAGGRGASTGIADVHNLVWKLQAVLREGATDQLLDTYHAERHPAGMQATQASGRNAKALNPLGASTWGDRWREMESHGVGNVYRSPLTVLSTTDTDPGEVTGAHDGTPGTRIPHRWVTPSEQSTLDLTGGHWSILSARSDWPGCPVRIIDPGADFVTATGIGQSGALLVRPDGFISWRGMTGETEQRELLYALRTIGSLCPALVPESSSVLS